MKAQHWFFLLGVCNVVAAVALLAVGHYETSAINAAAGILSFTWSEVHR
ncbi:MAG: hypothetical protein ABL912_14340 [Novosphingobium sp.]